MHNKMIIFSKYNFNHQTLEGLRGSGTMGDGLTNGGCFAGAKNKQTNKQLLFITNKWMS